MNKDGILQIARFMTVGVMAAVVHLTVVVSLVQGYSLEPLMANIAGFMIAFQVSYFGHRLWTFNMTEALHHEAYPKLVVVQVVNFAMNEALYYYFLSLHVPYGVALLVVLAILPVFTFVVNKFWVYQS